MNHLISETKWILLILMDLNVLLHPCVYILGIFCIDTPWFLVCIFLSAGPLTPIMRVNGARFLLSDKNNIAIKLPFLTDKFMTCDGRSACDVSDYRYSVINSVQLK